MQRLEEHGRIDVALVVRAEDGRLTRHVLAAGDPVADARAGERQAAAPVAERIQPPLPPEDDRDDEPDRPRYKDVGEDDDVGQDRADRDEESQRVKCTKKRPGDKLPGGEEG
jgi:hypothetical protein